MLRDDMTAVLDVEARLSERVIGQPHAISAVARRLRTWRAGLAEPGKPPGVFLLCGPTGVGKTETALALADLLFGGERGLVVINMSEFQEAHTVSTLKGSPPGYVGYGEGGVLTEAVRRRPYQVILFDEVEKAHEDVFNILLQVLDDGRLTDGQGRTVDFKNTMVIMTSNAQRDELPRLFRPEFLNRVDEVINFHSLDETHLKQIVDIQLASLKGRLAERRIELELTDAAREHIIRVGYDPAFGARPLKRAIQKELETPLARKLVGGEVKDGQKVIADVKGGELVLKVESSSAVHAS
jgi:ATP-dependent Clp protease ATP-binding subunit ClpB